MPSNKSKVKKVTPTTIIKIEPVELMPLGQYADDRVELIRQTFMNLKPKTIKSITPDFLQVKKNVCQKIKKKNKKFLLNFRGNQSNQFRNTV